MINVVRELVQQLSMLSVGFSVTRMMKTNGGLLAVYVNSALKNSPLSAYL